MRIRKNAKLSPLLFSSSSTSQGGSVPVETFQTHVCQLNQSPWDVIPFDSDSIQFEGEDSFTAGNGGSAGDSIGAVESVASMMDAEDKSLPKIEDMAMVDDNHDDKGAKMATDDNGNNKGVAKNSCCKSLDGKGWPCKNEAKQGQSFCHHHLLLRSYNNNSSGGGGYNTKKAAAAAAAAGARRARARAGKKTPSSNPYEFYYYSGFGPLWGKRRGDRNGAGGGGGGENSTMAESDNVITTPTPSSDAVANNNNNIQSVQIDNNEEFDYVDDDEEEDANDDGGKKRMRKPVKARSLKSLM